MKTLVGTPDPPEEPDRVPNYAVTSSSISSDAITASTIVRGSITANSVSHFVFEGGQWVNNNPQLWPGDNA